jgi:hypothetical protein
MKTLIQLFSVIITTAVLLFSNCVIGQTQNNSRLGIKGGIDVSSLMTDDAESSNLKLGINGGIFLRIAITDLFSFQPELIYTMKGGKLEYNNFASGTVKMSLNYTELPLLAVMNVTKNINLQGGIYLASLSNVRIRNIGDNGSYNFEEELNKDNFKSFDYGLVCGIGGDFDRLSFGVRYDYGVRSIGEKKTFAGQTYRFPDARNSAFQIYVGLSIL